MAWLLTPNDAAAFSSLVGLPCAAAGLRAGGGLWAAALAAAAGASLMYHAAETVRHDLGSHGLAGAGWAQTPLVPHEDRLLLVDRACAVGAFVATVASAGGPRASLAALAQRKVVVGWALLGLLALLASDFAGLTGWCYAAVHSLWHVAAFSSAWLLVSGGGAGTSLPRLAAADYIVVGLGNPGPKYDGTRHNVGADVAALLARRAGAALTAREACKARSVQLKRGDNSAVFARPLTYMNRSGQAVAALCQAHGVREGARLIVVHDELDLPPGRLKLKQGGGEAGHNGLRSIVQCLQSTDFVRVRIGVGKPPKGQGPSWVLSRPEGDEANDLQRTVELAADAVEAILDSGLERAMAAFNGKGPPQPLPAGNPRESRGAVPTAAAPRKQQHF